MAWGLTRGMGRVLGVNLADAVIEGWLFLGEALNLGQLSGIALILGGIVLAIVVADVWHWAPYMTLVMLGGLASIPKETEEAARVDCCSISDALGGFAQDCGIDPNPNRQTREKAATSKVP